MAKSKYESHVAPFIDKISRWAEKGATAKEIAKKLNVAYSTFRKYIDEGSKGDERYAALSAAFTQACEVPDDEVEASLYKLCNGYNAPIAKNFKVKEVIYDPDTGRKVKEVEKLIKGFDEVHVQANVTAQMFWLANRRGDRWRYKPEPADGDENESTGVVVLPAVMDNPGPPSEEVEANG